MQGYNFLLAQANVFKFDTDLPQEDGNMILMFIFVKNKFYCNVLAVFSSCNLDIITVIHMQDYNLLLAQADVFKFDTNFPEEDGKMIMMLVIVINGSVDCSHPDQQTSAIRINGLSHLDQSTSAIRINGLSHLDKWTLVIRINGLQPSRSLDLAICNIGLKPSGSTDLAIGLQPFG